MIQHKKITILDLRDSPWVDGPGRTTLESAIRIDREKYHIIVAGFSGGAQKTGEYLREAERRGLPVARLEESGAFDPGVFKQVLHLIDLHAVDIIHTHEFRSNVIGLVCARLRRLPVVATCHGWIANSAKGKIRVFLDRLALYFFDHIIVVSKKLQAQLNRQGIGMARTSALPNAVAFENFLRVPGESRFRNELGVQSSTVLIANIGRLSPEKGQFEFIRAASAVLRDYPDVRFILIGIGPDQSRLVQLVNEYGIAGKVIFCGYRADMPNIYSSLDLVVQSSFTEGMPNVILEAAAMEIPVIATQVGGTAEIIEHGVSGILVRPGATEELASAVLNFLRHRMKHQDMARRAAYSVRQRFSYESRTGALIKIYDNLVSRKRPRQ